MSHRRWWRPQGTPTEAEGVEVVQIDGKTLPFANEEFDVSFTATVLMHNPDSTMVQIVDEMCRITRSSIYLIEDTFPTPSNPSPKAAHRG